MHKLCVLSCSVCQGEVRGCDVHACVFIGS